ncbi:MAG: Cna B-type domain-containing protein, partial [Raoultibacter sp.]
MKNWNDNNNALGKRPTATVFQAQLSLEYSANPADPATWIPLTEDNKAQLGYSALPSIPSATEVNYSTWNYPFENTLNLFNDKGEKVTYRLAESVLAGYISSYAGEDNTLTNTALNPFVATKKWADAANAYHTRISPEQWIDSVNGSGEATRGVHRVIEGVTPSQDVPLTLTTTDRFAEGYVEVAENGAD